MASRIADELYWMADTLLPCEPPYPSAATVGTQASLAARIVGLRGFAVLDDILRKLTIAGGPLAPLDPSGRVEVLKALAAADPRLFADLCKLLVVGYHESPVVGQIEAKQGRSTIPHVVWVGSPTDFPAHQAAALGETPADMGRR